MSFKFGSFNLERFGFNSISNRDLSKIYDIIKGEFLDVVAFQEVYSEGKAIEFFLKRYFPNWKYRFDCPYIFSDPLKTKGNHTEGYALIWNPSKLTLATSATSNGSRIYEPRAVSKAVRYSVNCFARTPFYARFIPVFGGNFEFRIINIHLFHGQNDDRINCSERKKEYDFLIQKIYPSISLERRYANNRPAYTIIMGDYNLCLVPPGQDNNISESNIFIKRSETIDNQEIVTIQDQPSSLKDATKYDTNNLPADYFCHDFDHFSFDINLFKSDGINYTESRINAVEKYCNNDFKFYYAKVSNHVPISLEINFKNEHGVCYGNK